MSTAWLLPAFDSWLVRRAPTRTTLSLAAPPACSSLLSSRTITSIRSPAQLITTAASRPPLTMLLSKHKRQEDDSSSSVFPFLYLPNELQAKIIELACRMPSIKKDPYPDLTKLRDARRPPRTLLDLDLETTLDLTTVCQSIYPHAARVLYSHIRVTRPSSLQLLHRSLVERPSSGLDIKSLHIGPTDRNPYRRWWPIEPAWADHGLEEYGCGTATLSDSSWTLEDELRMPQWYGSGSWPISPTRSPPDCRGISVVEAIKAAQRFIDVDLEVSPCNFARQDIGMVSRREVLKCRRSLQLMFLPFALLAVDMDDARL